MKNLGIQLVLVVMTLVSVSVWANSGELDFNFNTMCGGVLNVTSASRTDDILVLFVNKLGQQKVYILSHESEYFSGHLKNVLTSKNKSQFICILTDKNSNEIKTTLLL